MRDKGKLSVAALSALLFMPVPAESKLVQGTITGALSDSMCNADHASMIKMGHGKDAVSCTQKCLKEGYKLVFVDRKTKTVYTLQNPGLARKLRKKMW